MDVNLTQGAIARIFSNDSVYCNPNDREINPVLQIIEIEKLCVRLSDGTNSDIGLFAGKLFGSLAYLEKLELQKGSIIKLSVYTLSQSLNRVIFIFDCDVLRNKCDIIGEPVPLPKNTHSHPNGSNILLKYHTLPQPDLGGCFNILSLYDLGFSDTGIVLSQLTLYDETKGALETMCSHNSVDFDFMPGLVLQALDSYMDSYYGYFHLSDGKSTIYAFLPTHLAYESGCYHVKINSSGFKDKLLIYALPEMGSIVKLTNYMLKEFHGIKFIIILEFDVVLEKHVPIGLPRPPPPKGYDVINEFITKFPPFNLTQGAIETILSGNFTSDKGFKPLLQVLGMNMKNIFVTDGVYVFSLTCHDNLPDNLRVQFQTYGNHPVIKLTDYCVHENSENHKLVVILGAEVILHYRFFFGIGMPVRPPNKEPYLGVSPPERLKNILFR